jgi:hypothetical protein
VLETKRANQVAFAIPKLPEAGVLGEIFDEMDDARLNLEQLASLEKVAPTAEEVAALKKALADLPPGLSLDKPEAFALALAGIPRLVDRAKLWSFKLNVRGFC